MTPLELSYPLVGLVLALGGGLYGWQAKRQAAQSLSAAPSPVTVGDRPSPEQSIAPALAPPTLGEDVIHLQGKLRRLDQDLQETRTRLGATLQDQESLTQQLRQQEILVATLRQQLAQQKTQTTEAQHTLERQNQTLQQENQHLSDQLRRSVAELAETRPKLLQLQALTAKNEALAQQVAQLQSASQSAQQKTEQETALTQQIQDLQRQLTQLTTERDQALGALEAVNRQSDANLDQIAALEAKMGQLTQTQQDWSKEKDRLTAQLAHLESQQKDLTLANQELTVKLEATQTEGDRLKTQKKEQTAALHQAQAEIATLKDQLAQIQTVTPAKDSKEQKAPVVETPEEAPVTVSPPVTETPEEAVPVAEIVEETPVEAHLPVTETPEEPVAETSAVEPRGQETPVVESPGTDTPAHALDGKSIVILGTLNSMNRETAKERLQTVGAIYSNNPSTNIDYVVVGKAPGAKLKKAQKLGLPQLSESQFLDLLEGK